MSKTSKVRFLAIPDCVDADVIMPFAKNSLNVIGTVEEIDWFAKTRHECKHIAEYISPNNVLRNSNSYRVKPKNSITFGKYIVIHPEFLNEKIIEELLKAWDDFSNLKKKTPSDKFMIENWQTRIEIIKQEDFINKIIIQDIIV